MLVFNRLIGIVALLEGKEGLRAKFSADSVTGSEDLTIRGETGPELVLSGMTTRDKWRLVRVLLGQIRREAKMRKSPDEFFVLRSEMSYHHSIAEAERAEWLAERERYSALEV